MRIIQNKAYSLKSFKGYTNRYIISIMCSGEEHRLEIYTTNEDADEVFKIILDAAVLKDGNVDREASSIVHKSTKEDDEGASELIDETIDHL